MECCDLNKPLGRFLAVQLIFDRTQYRTIDH